MGEMEMKSRCVAPPAASPARPGSGGGAWPTSESGTHGGGGAAYGSGADGAGCAA